MQKLRQKAKCIIPLTIGRPLIQAPCPSPEPPAHLVAGHGALLEHLHEPRVRQPLRAQERQPLVPRQQHLGNDKDRFVEDGGVVGADW